MDEEHDQDEAAGFVALNRGSKAWLDHLPACAKEAPAGGRDDASIECVTHFVRACMSLTRATTVPAAAGVATIHHPSIAFDVYLACRADPSGRVHRLARHHPLLLALWLEARLPHSPLLSSRERELVASTAEHFDIGPARRATFTWWLRALPPWVDARRLPLLVAFDVPRSDRPPCPDDQTVWYRTLVAAAGSFSNGVPAEPARHAMRFLSRHYDEAARFPDLYSAKLAQYLRVTGRRLSRRRDPKRFTHELREWLAGEQDPAATLTGGALPAPGDRGDSAGPTPCADSWRTTIGELSEVLRGDPAEVDANLLAAQLGRLRRPPGVFAPLADVLLLERVLGVLLSTGWHGRLGDKSLHHWLYDLAKWADHHDQTAERLLRHALEFPETPLRVALTRKRRARVIRNPRGE